MNKKIRFTDTCDKCFKSYEVIKIINIVKEGYYIIKIKCPNCGKEGFFQRRYKRKED